MRRLVRSKFPREKSIPGDLQLRGRDDTAERNGDAKPRALEIRSVKLEEVVRSAMMAFMRESIPHRGETGSSPCGVGRWHMSAHVFPLPHPSLVYNGSLPHPFTPVCPHLRRSLTQRLGVLADRMTLRILIRPFTESRRMHVACNAFLILSGIKSSHRRYASEYTLLSQSCFERVLKCYY